MNRAKLWTRLAIVGIACVSAAPVFAAHNAVETTLNEVVLPATAGGTIVLRPCDTCAPKSIRVTAQSRYFITGTEVTLKDFLEQSKLHSMSLVVSYDTQTLELVTLKAWL